MNGGEGKKKGGWGERGRAANTHSPHHGALGQLPQPGQDSRRIQSCILGHQVSTERWA